MDETIQFDFSQALLRLGIRIAQLLGIETEQKIPPNTLLSRADVSAATV
jgi:hypothetical protein